jgi:hypothetical protein
MVSLSCSLHFKCPFLNLFSSPRPYNCIFRHFGNLLIDLSESFNINQVTILHLLLQVCPHHVLFIFELIQSACLILVDQLNGPLDALSRALHVLMDAERSGSLTLPHFLHQHLSFKQLFMRFV